MKNKIKERILCLMQGVGVAVAVGVTGCGKSDASSDSEETNPVAVQEKRVVCAVTKLCHRTCF